MDNHICFDNLQTTYHATYEHFKKGILRTKCYQSNKKSKQNAVNLLIIGETKFVILCQFYYPGLDPSVSGDMYYLWHHNILPAYRGAATRWRLCSCPGLAQGKRSSVKSSLQFLLHREGRPQIHCCYDNR